MKILQLFLTISIASCIIVLTGCKNISTKTSVKDDNAGTKQQQNQTIADQNSLHEAALNGQYELVRELLSKNVDANSRDQDGRTALMFASYNGHADIAKELIEKGAEINTKDNYGRTALMFASTGPYSETVELLLENDADPNLADAEEHFTALMYAAAEGQLEVVKLLLTYDADPALNDVDGDIAETFARNNGHIEVAELLSSVSE